MVKKWEELNFQNAGVLDWRGPQITIPKYSFFFKRNNAFTNKRWPVISAGLKEKSNHNELAFFFFWSKEKENQEKYKMSYDFWAPLQSRLNSLLLYETRTFYKEMYIVTTRQEIPHTHKLFPLPLT